MIRKFFADVQVQVQFQAQVWRSRTTPQVAAGLVAITIVTVMFAIYLLRVVLSL